MALKSDKTSEFIEPVIGALNTLVRHLPTILAVIVIIALGWIIARILRGVIRKTGTASNQWLMRVFPSGIFAAARMSSSAVTLLGELVFWAVLLITVTVAANFAELGSVSVWLDNVTALLPHVIAGIAIVVIGYFLSVFAREQLQTQTNGGAAAAPFGRIAQVTVISIALIIALDQVGIDVALLIGLMVVVVAGVLTAVVVAFASGARAHISNLIGVRTALVHLAAGMTIEVDDIQGEIVELTPTLIALETDQGRVLIPGKVIDERVITVVSSGRRGAET